MARSLLCVSALLLSATVQARTLEVGESKEFKAPSAALAAAQDGDRIAIYPGEYFDCAITAKNRLRIEGVGKAEDIAMTDKSCGGKGILVLGGANVVVHNLTLARARVPDGNGAGIRDEGKDLTIEGVRFVNNQNGILRGVAGGGTMTIRDSLFERNGACEKSCAHGLYVGGLDKLRVERSHFLATKHAHHVKSRARRTEILDCVIEDGPDGTASYEIETPGGGDLVVRNTIMEKGPNSENHKAAIMIGAEGIDQPTKEILIENNSFRNDGDFETTFVNNLSATEAVLRGNKLSGAVQALKGDGQVVAAQ